MQNETQLLSLITSKSLTKCYSSAPEYWRSSVDLNYRSVSTTGMYSQENSQ